MSNKVLSVKGRPSASRFWEYSTDNSSSFEVSIRKQLSIRQKEQFDNLLVCVRQNVQPDRGFLVDMIALFSDTFIDGERIVNPSANERQYFMKLFKKYYTGNPDTLRMR
jgi:hypothetical protein